MGWGDSRLRWMLEAQYESRSGGRLQRDGQTVVPAFRGVHDGRREEQCLQSGEIWVQGVEENGWSVTSSECERTNTTKCEKHDAGVGAGGGSVRGQVRQIDEDAKILALTPIMFETLLGEAGVFPR